MISNKYINAIIAFFTAIAVLFTSIIYVKSKNLDSETTASLNNFTYVDTVLNKEQVTEIDVEITEDNWNYLLENAIDEQYVTANITVNGTKYYNVGIRAKGNSSLSMVASDNTTDRYSFKVKFDEYVEGQTLDGLSKISLNNVMSDATYMKEYLSYDLLEKMDVPTPAFAFTNIKINGEEWGLYFGVEVIEEEFIARNYGSLYGNLYKPEGSEIGNMGNKENMEIPEGFTPPDMNNGEVPKGFTPPTGEQGNNPQGFTPTNMNNREIPEGFTPPDMSNSQNFDNQVDPNKDNTQSEENITSEEIENFKSNGFRGGGMMGGMGSSNGSNLVYTDDNKESYSAIFDNNVFKTTTDSDEDKVIEMIKNLNEGTNLEEYLNVEEILRYFAVNTFLVNLDSYASNMKHNYYLYERNGIFEIIPWDYNLSFAGFNIGNASKAINFPIDSPVTDSLENSPLIGKLLEVDKYNEAYHNYLQEIVDYVNNGTYSTTIHKVNKLISKYVQNDATAFYTYEEYTASIPELINFGIDRAKSISAQLDGSQPSTTYGTIETTVDLTALGSQGGMMNFKSPTNNSTDSSTIENNEVQEDQMPGGHTPDGQMPGGQTPNSEMPGGQMPNDMQIPNTEDNNIDSTTGASINNKESVTGGNLESTNSNKIEIQNLTSTNANSSSSINNTGSNNKKNQFQNSNNTTNEILENNRNSNNTNRDNAQNSDTNTENNKMQRPQKNNQEINQNNKDIGFNKFNNTQKSSSNIVIQTSIYSVILLSAIVFVSLFKRRRFNAK